MAIKCCYGCVAPKRYPGCHGTCPEYLAEKAKHNEEMAADYKRRNLQGSLNAQRGDAITKANKHKRHHKEG